MIKKNKGIISELIAARANLVELVVVAVLLAISVNLVSSSLPIIVPMSPAWTLVAGSIIGILVLSYTGLRFLSSRHKITTLEGFFVYDKKKNSIISIPRYQYGSQISAYLQAACIENKELKSWWNDEPLREQIKVSDKGIMFKQLRSHQLIIEATEYFVLDELSLHLSSYFGNKGYREGTLETIARNDIPNLLLNNHFLALFSGAMKKRPGFTEGDTKKTISLPGKGKLYFIRGNEAGLYIGRMIRAYGIDGEFYNRFELVLPKNSRLDRSQDGELKISTKRFRIIIAVDFLGMGADVPDEFYQFTLGLGKKLKDVTEFEVRVKIDVTFKPLAFLSSKGMEYYYWIDSFLDRFMIHFSKDVFFDSIGWCGALTVMQFMRTHLDKKRVSKKK